MDFVWWCGVLMLRVLSTRKWLDKNIPVRYNMNVIKNTYMQRQQDWQLRRRRDSIGAYIAKDRAKYFLSGLVTGVVILLLGYALMTIHGNNVCRNLDAQFGCER